MPVSNAATTKAIKKVYRDWKDHLQFTQPTSRNMRTLANWGLPPEVYMTMALFFLEREIGEHPLGFSLFLEGFRTTPEGAESLPFTLAGQGPGFFTNKLDELRTCLLAEGTIDPAYSIAQLVGALELVPSYDFPSAGPNMTWTPHVREQLERLQKSRS